MKGLRLLLGLATAVAVLVAGCGLESSAQTSPTYWPTNGWRASAPEQQGMDSSTLAQMVEKIRRDKLGIHSMLIVRNGYLVNELYVYPYSASQPHWTASTTKSVMGALVGIAIQEGFIKSVDQRVLGLLGEQGVANLNDWKREITLRDLLTQTSGLDTTESAAPGGLSMQASDNWVRWVLDRPMVAEPGTRFNYSTDAGQLLSASLQKATGVSAREFADQYLFGPMGIAAISAERWPSDPQGVTIGGYGLALTPSEMAKLGYLFLERGRWDGGQVVPADWVATSTTAQSASGGKKEYGYLWWVDPQKSWYAALGRGGQHVFVYPAQNIVVVFTGDLPAGNDADLTPLQQLLDRYVLPAVKSRKPLPANPSGVARLRAATREMSLPESAAPQQLPTVAAQVSGKTYALDENPLGWRTISFSFKDGAAESTVAIDGAQVAVGMDNVYRVRPIMGSPFPEGVRAHWAGQNTLVVDDLAIGAMAQLSYRIRFVGDRIDITREEKYSSSKVEVSGTLTSGKQK